MKFPSVRITQATASLSYGRTQLHHVYLDVEAGELQATSGHILARVPVEVEAGDVSGYILVQALHHARWPELRAQAGGACQLLCAEKEVTAANGRVYPRPDENRWPDVDRVTPDPAGMMSVCVNAQLLAALQSAIATQQAVVLRFRPDGLGSIDPRAPIRVEAVEGDPSGGYGVIMPVTP